MVGGAVMVTRKSRVILSSIWLLPFAVVLDVLTSSKYVYLLRSCDILQQAAVIATFNIRIIAS
jgi:hypothetical protein